MRDLTSFYTGVLGHVAELSRCNNAKVGAILVHDGNIVSFGYNGTPNGFCNDCEDENGRTKPEVLHAETNAIMKAVKNGSALQGADLYCSLSPCIECAKLIVQAGIRRVHYINKYRSTEGIDLLQKCQIECNQLT